MNMTIGVLALQGELIEHIKMLAELGVDAVEVRKPEHLDDLDALIIPGGESTTIGKLARTYGLLDPLRSFTQQKPTWGTCAGLIFLAKRIGRDQPLVGAMDITVERNAFGRQVDSFEVDILIEGIGDEPFRAVFIRAPVITHADEDKGVEVLAELPEKGIVAVRQGHLLGTAFHPELTADCRLHELFVRMVEAEKSTEGA
ncbi:MAG: pyridoxal 5'-phosphate synthase glutaminase subunit PdxT [Anaerolineae bacterium]